MFDDLTEMVNKAFTYIPMTDERMQISYVDDISEWAYSISSEWNGETNDKYEDRANCAREIMDKCDELKALIAEMEQL